MKSHHIQRTSALKIYSARRLVGAVLGAVLVATGVLVASFIPMPSEVEATACADTTTSSSGTNPTTYVVTFNTAAACTFALPSDVTSLDYLVVGGGGGGGGGDRSPAKGGQGGRGGVVAATSGASVTAGSTLTVTVGAGGAGGAGQGNGGASGASSLSGGGLSVTAAGGTSGTAGTNSDNSSGSGTGIGGAGQNPGNGFNVANSGGNGTSNSITGSAVVYGGGGGGGSSDTGTNGGSGGTGGGGTGGKPNSTLGTAGTNGRGGGGGGGGGDNTSGNITSGGAGGRGVVIIKYTADTTAPTATLSPLDDSTDVSTSADLVLTFSESVTAQSSGANTVVIKKTSDNSTVETISANDAKVTVSGSTVTVNPAATLAKSTEYYVQIGANAFKDAAGNAYAGISDTTSWSFTTSSAAAVSSVAISSSGGGDNTDRWGES